MATYAEAPSVQPLIDELIKDFYPDLVETEAKVRAVFASSPLDRYGAPKGAAVKESGTGVVCKVKPNSEADKAEGKPDATITIDVREWRRIGEEPNGSEVQEAYIDRMLYTLRVRKVKGEFVTNDDGRPKLRKEPADWLISGYRAMASRHKEHSAEVRQARALHDAYGNLLFNFADDLAEEQPSLPGVERDKPRRGKRGAAAVAATHR